MGVLDLAVFLTGQIGTTGSLLMVTAQKSDHGDATRDFGCSPNRRPCLSERLALSSSPLQSVAQLRDISTSSSWL